jgi:glycosyltransferase involved in cell wall biosynthesis
VKILQLVEPGVNGCFRHVEGLVDYLLTAGVDVDLGYSARRGSDRLEALVARMKAAGKITFNLDVENAPEWRDLAAFGSLARYIRRYRPDVIHAHSSKAGVLGRACRVLAFRGKIFYTPHAYYGMGNCSGLKGVVFNGVERLFGKVGTTINVSREEAEFAANALGISPAKQVVVNNGVNTARFCPGDEEAILRWKQTHDLPSDAILIGTAGRLDFQKDPLTLLRSVAPILRDESKVFLMHVGEGELERDYLEAAREERVESKLRRVSYLADTSDFYRALDLFILTSRYEGLSLALLEALSTNVPLLVSDVPGNRGLKEMQLSHFWTAQKENKGSFQKAIGEWFRDRTLFRPCNHREVALRDFDKDRCYQEILELYAGTK